MDFIEWLETSTTADGAKLSKSSISKYNSAVRVISKLALEHNIITTDLYNMSLYELDVAISNIFNWDEFIKKNKVGNNMYSSGLKRFRCYKYLIADKDTEEKFIVTSINNDASLDLTTKEMIIKSRVGQGIFRERLLKKYDSKCIITNITIPQTLIASHIKPWAVCNNSTERLSSDNGLLLSATYDKLFDSGLITFNFDGTIKLSRMINQHDAKLLHIDDKKKIYNLKYNDKMHDFLEYHHKYIFIDKM